MARNAMLARREDARRKIILGGLVIKAKLEGEPPEVLLGALLAVARALQGDNGSEWRAKYARAGKAAFGVPPRAKP